MTYKENEVSRPDQFAHPYIGKEYESIEKGKQALEPLPMFATYITLTPEKRLAMGWKEDREWLMFCIDLLMDPGSYS